MPCSQSLVYLKFLNLVQAVKGLPEFPEMDPVEERLLNLFAAIWHADKKITVLQAMGISNDMSSTTAHRRLKSMCQKGIIVLVSDDADNRIKYVTPTAVANHYFAQLGRCLSEAQAA